MESSGPRAVARSAAYARRGRASARGSTLRFGDNLRGLGGAWFERRRVLAPRCLGDTVLTGHIVRPAAGLRATRALRPLEGGFRTGGAALRLLETLRFDAALYVYRSNVRANSL